LPPFQLPHYDGKNKTTRKDRGLESLFCDFESMRPFKRQQNLNRDYSNGNLLFQNTTLVEEATDALQISR
jgi:hypothetical protein